VTVMALTIATGYFDSHNRAYPSLVEGLVRSKKKYEVNLEATQGDELDVKF
jgi:hypothetical protein